MADDDTTPQDDTTPTPEPPAAAEAADDTVDEPTEPTPVADTTAPAATKAEKRDKPGVFVPRWLAILLGLLIVILLAAGGGFWAGRETADDDDHGDHRQSSQPAPREVPDRPDQPETPFPLPQPPSQPDENAAFLGVGVSESTDPAGVLVEEVAPGSPADDAGVEVGDVIVAIDGDEVDGTDALREALADKEPGDVVTLTVDRDGTETDLQPTLSTPDAQDA